MINLFALIYAKAYCFYLFFDKEDGYPQFYASGILSLIVSLTGVVFVEIILYQFNPLLIIKLLAIFKYFSVLNVFLFMYIFRKRDRSEYMLGIYKSTGIRKRRLLTIIILVYLIILFGAYFHISNLVRDFNK